MTQTGFMLDTNIFDKVAKDTTRMLLSSLRGRNLFATHIQWEELNQTSDSGRRKELLVTFKDIDAQDIPTENAVYDLSVWDRSKYSPDDGVYEAMLKRLRRLDEDADKSPRNPKNQQRDILIAQTSIRRGLLLVSNDRNLRIVTAEFGGTAINLDDLNEIPRRNEL
jgi:hypothetical protein